jgi:hypothetical protein
LSRKINEKVAQIFLPEFVQNGDPLQFAKKFLTFGRLSLIIGSVRRARELPAAVRLHAGAGRAEKKFSKPLDKPLEKCYNKDNPRGTGGVPADSDRAAKNFWKVQKST